jgi:hypothetical protein
MNARKAKKPSHVNWAFYLDSWVSGSNTEAALRAFATCLMQEEFGAHGQD